VAGAGHGQVSQPQSVLIFAVAMATGKSAPGAGGVYFSTFLQGHLEQPHFLWFSAASRRSRSANRGFSTTLTVCEGHGQVTQPHADFWPSASA